VTVTVYVTVSPPAGFALSTVFVMARSAVVVAVPPQFTVQMFGAIVTGTVAVLFPGFGSVELALSPTTALFVRVVLAVPVFTVPAIWRVALELAIILPIVQVPVELA